MYCLFLTKIWTRHMFSKILLLGIKFILEVRKCLNGSEQLNSKTDPVFSSSSVRIRQADTIQKERGGKRKASTVAAFPYLASDRAHSSAHLLEVMSLLWGRGMNPLTDPWLLAEARIDCPLMLQPKHNSQVAKCSFWLNKSSNLPATGQRLNRKRKLKGIMKQASWGLRSGWCVRNVCIPHVLKYHNDFFFKDRRSSFVMKMFVLIPVSLTFPFPFIATFVEIVY